MNKDRYPKDFKSPSLIVFVGLLSGYLFVLVATTVFLRIFTGKSLPA
jgi:hypothetical protein